MPRTPHLLQFRRSYGWHHIALFSLKFTETERHYPIYEKEMVGIVKSFDHWRQYLDAADIEVGTSRTLCRKPA